jgi:hypothetical protein
MNPDGPYVVAASLCENFLEEPGHRVSLIRLLDRMDTEVKVPHKLGDAAPAIPLPLTGFVSFKSGKFVGAKKVRIDFEKPSGQIVPTAQNALPVVFEGGEHGVNLRLQLTIVVNEDGLYWFNVYLDDELMTRIPLRISVRFQEAAESDLKNLESVPETKQSEPRQIEP